MKCPACAAAPAVDCAANIPVAVAFGTVDAERCNSSHSRRDYWARAQGPRVDWIAQARWVEDRDRWTSADVAAGMDMTLALIARLHSDELAAAIADQVEYDWHRNATWDPFAAKNGLVVD